MGQNMFFIDEQGRSGARWRFLAPFGTRAPIWSPASLSGPLATFLVRVQRAATQLCFSLALNSWESSVHPVSLVPPQTHSLPPGSVAFYPYRFTKAASSKLPVRSHSSVFVLKFISGTYFTGHLFICEIVSSFDLSHFVFLLQIIFVNKCVSALDLLISWCFWMFQIVFLFSLYFFNSETFCFYFVFSHLIIICSYYAFN